MRRTPVRAPSRILFALLAASLALALAAPAAMAAKEWGPGKYLNQALGRLTDGTRRVTEQTKFGLDDGSTCFVGALLLPGKANRTRIPLQGGVEYAFIGGGDDDVRDMDLYLLDDDGNVVDKDEARNASPVLVFTPPADGRYTIEMKLVDSKATSSFCCYATLRAGGFDVPVRNLRGACDRLLELCETVNTTIGNAWFHDQDGQMCMFGTILKESQTLTESNFELEDRPYVFVGAADDVAKDIDLKVIDANGDTIAKDDKDDAIPVVVTGGGRTVGVKLTNAKSGGASLCLAAAIKLPKN